jgi:hypothetical protein
MGLLFEQESKASASKLRIVQTLDNPDAPAGTVLSYSLAEFRQALKYPKPIA